ncbi:hypothetical protein CYY_003733 [Polysphondylium violaceum]|uniref:ABC transporter domain-containing protein n=1 Tax=Polysphondylium violaceum TaxID=133409 RepID=A0A8J4PWC5_9MYCE|nr:hypothetical protein CYY_003733 [Polysphondylium violaceum]
MNIKNKPLWFNQFYPLLYKQFLLFKTNRIISAIRLLSPIISLLIYILIFVSLDKKANTVITPYSTESYPSESFPTGFKSPCCSYVIGYSFDQGLGRVHGNGKGIGGVVDSDHLNKLVLDGELIMQRVANSLDLTIGTDVVPVPLEFRTNQTDLVEKGGSNGVPTYFATLYFYRLNDSMIFYNLLYNGTSPRTNPLVTAISYHGENRMEIKAIAYATSIQIAIEREFLSVFAKQDVDLSVNSRKAPTILSWDKLQKTVQSKVTSEVVQSVKALVMIFVFLGQTFPTIVFLSTRVEETGSNMRAYLRTSGVYDEVYILVWLIDGMIGHLWNTLVIMVIGYTCPGLDFVYKCNPLILFSVLMVYGFTIYSFTLFFSSFISTLKSSVILSVLSFTLGLFSVLVFCLFSIASPILYMPGFRIVGIVTTILPFTNIAKVLGDIQLITAPMPFWYGLFDTGLKYHQENFTARTFFHWEYDGDFSDYPTCFESICFMLLSGLVSLFLCWYLDKVVEGAHGGKQSPLFLFDKKYWKPSTKEYDLENISSLRGTVADSHQDPDIVQEATNVNLDNIKNYALVIRNLVKSYNGKTPAVDGLNLSSEKGKILCLLGPNGSGKTTTINCLTQQTTPNLGYALVCGYNAHTQSQCTSKIIGYTPQFDVHWPHLSARQHLAIMYLIKRTNPLLAIDDEVESILKDIRLTSVADNPVCTYSGGMARRLSVGLALIGNPKIIILDEPTTGIDSSNRQYIWRLIKSMKSDRLILLTTHSMEEAENADKIAIMQTGKLIAVGTPIHLKTRYSKGYTLKLVTKDPVTVGNMVNSSTFNPTLTEEKVSNSTHTTPDIELIYSIENMDTVSNLLQYLFEHPDSTQIQEWSLDGTKILDVYLKLIPKHQK